MYYYNGTQRYEQFLQVGRLYQALLLLGLALCLQYVYIYFKKFVYILLFTFYRAGLVGLALDVVDERAVTALTTCKIVSKMNDL